MLRPASTNTFPLPSPEHPFSNPEPTCALQAPCGWGCAAPGCPQVQTQPTLCALPTKRGGDVPAPHLSGAERTFRTAQQPGQEQRGLRRDPTFCTEGCATTGTAQLLLLRAWLPKAVQHSCLYQPCSSFWELQDRAAQPQVMKARSTRGQPPCVVLTPQHGLLSRCRSAEHLTATSCTQTLGSPKQP